MIRFNALLVLLFVNLVVVAQNKNSSTNNSQSSSVAAKKTTETVLSTSVNKPFPQNEIANTISSGNQVHSFLGVYSIHAGVQKTDIGRLTLESNGQYKVSLVSDRDKVSTGTYEYGVKSGLLAWTGGFLLSKKFKGELSKTQEGSVKIYLSPSTYAVKVD